MTRNNVRDTVFGWGFFPPKAQEADRNDSYSPTRMAAVV